MDNLIDDPGLAQMADAASTARRQKANLGVLGAIGDNLASRQSIGNFALGKMNAPDHTASQTADAVSGSIQDPYQQSKLVTDYMNQKYGLAKAQRDESSATGTDVADFARDTYGDKFKIPQGITNDQFGRIAPLIKQKAEQDLVAKKADALIAATQLRANNTAAGLDLRKDNQTVRAGDRISNDPQIKQLTQQDQVLGRGYEILSKPTVTNQEFNDAQIELGNAIAGAKSGALGKLERTEYDTAQQKLAGLKQMVTGSPQDAVPKELLDRVRGLIDETRASFSRHRQERAQSLKAPYASNDAANARQDEVIQGYQAPAPQPSAQTPAYDADVLDYAKTHNITPDQAQAVKSQRTGK